MFEKFINIVKLGFLYKNKTVLVKNNRINLNLTKQFIKLNLIKFSKKKNKHIMLYLNYINHKPVFQNIINLFKPSRMVFISLKNIKKINKKKNYILIMSTNLGLLNNFEAEQLKCGGLIISKIWS